MSDLSETTRALLDTNAFLYFINNDPALGKAAKAVLESNAALFISTAGLWEIAIKFSIGKIELPSPLEDFIPEQLEQNDIEILPITLFHVFGVSQLPFHHKDPFDRLIIAQSLVETMPIVGSDTAFDHYGIERIW